MNKSVKFDLVKYEDRFASATVSMWRDSKEQALGVKEIHSFDDHLFFLRDILAKENDVRLAVLDDRNTVVGIIATDGEFVNQLYIHTNYQRMGIGSKLLKLAKYNSTGKLSLNTFNRKYQR